MPPLDSECNDLENLRRSIMLSGTALAALSNAAAIDWRDMRDTLYTCPDVAVV
jgi:hypothetical protein